MLYVFFLLNSLRFLFKFSIFYKVNFRPLDYRYILNLLRINEGLTRSGGSKSGGHLAKKTVEVSWSQLKLAEVS